MLGTYINFDTNFATSTLSYAGTLVSDLNPYLTLIIGVLITILIIAVLVRVLHK